MKSLVIILVNLFMLPGALFDVVRYFFHSLAPPSIQMLRKTKKHKAKVHFVRVGWALISLPLFLLLFVVPVFVFISTFSLMFLSAAFIDETP